MSRPSRDRAVREPIGIGEALRLAREALGLTLSQVAQETRIRAPFLLALEEEDFADLPAPIYARAFLRTYAERLGLDVESLVALLDEHHRLDSEAKLEPATRVVSSDSGFSRLIAPAGFGAFVLGAAYFLFVQYSAFVASQEITPLSMPTSVPAVARQESSVAPKPIAVPTLTPVPPTVTPTQVPATPTTSATAATTRTVAPTASGAVKTATARPSASPPAASPTVKAPVATPSAQTSPQPSAQPTQSPPAQTPTALISTPTPAQPTPPPPTAPPTAVPPTATPSGQPATVEARFSGDCWIVAEIDDKIVQNGVTQKAGDRISWTGRKFAVKFGNAGVVDLSLNGKPAARLGATGEVVNWNWSAP